MSERIYGLINKVDASCLERAINFIQNDFPGEVINYTEVGLYNGRTTNAIKDYLESVNAKYNITGIDNFKDKEELVFFPKEAALIQGSSIEVYNQLTDESQHLVLIDANHSFPYVVADFYCYRDKVKKNGYISFHDAAPHSQWKSYQRMGSEDDPDMYISVLKALEKIGLLNKQMAASIGFEKVFHEWDTDDEGGGTIVFRKLFKQFRV